MQENAAKMCYFRRILLHYSVSLLTNWLLHSTMMLRRSIRIRLCGGERCRCRVHRGIVGLCSRRGDRKSTRLNSSHQIISYAVFCLKKKNENDTASKPAGHANHAP